MLEREEKKRISNVGADLEASSIRTDCIECHREITLPITHPEESDLLVYEECCNYIYTLEPVIDLVVYKKDE